MAVGFTDESRRNLRWPHLSWSCIRFLARSVSIRVQWPAAWFALGQLIRRDRAERGGTPSEPVSGTRKRIGALEPEATRRQRSEQQGAAQIRPVLQVRLDARRPRERHRGQVHPGFL